MYRRKDICGGYGDIEAIWANLTHPNRNQRNIIVLLLIRRVDLHITDDGIHHLFYRHLSWDMYNTYNNILYVVSNTKIPISKLLQ